MHGGRARGHGPARGATGLAVSRLFVYPIKSLGGMQLDAAEVEARGCRPGWWTKAARSSPSVATRAWPSSASASRENASCGGDADRWFARFLGASCRLRPWTPATRAPGTGSASPTGLPVPAALRGLARRPQRQARKTPARRPLPAQHRRRGLRPLRGGPVADGAHRGRRLPGRQAVRAVRRGPGERQNGEGAAEDARHLPQGRKQRVLRAERHPGRDRPRARRRSHRGRLPSARIRSPIFRARRRIPASVVAGPISSAIRRKPGARHRARPRARPRYLRPPERLVGEVGHDDGGCSGREETAVVPAPPW